MEKTLPLLLAAVLAAAGCLGSEKPKVEESTEDSSSRAVPAGCDSTRPAVAHYQAGSLVYESDDAAPIACASYTGSGSGEPTLGVSPQTGAVFFYPAADLASIPSRVGVSKTSDEGATWQLIVPKVAGQDAHPTTLDPYLYLDPTTGRLFADDLITPNCNLLSWSDDEGATWDHTVTSCTQFDHQTLFAGPPVESTPLDYPNVVYMCAMNTVALSTASTTSTCTKSLDGGRSFVPTGAPAFVADPRRPGHGSVPGYCGGAVGHGVVGPDGTVYVPKGWCGQPWLAISKDEGRTWTRTQVSDLGLAEEDDGTQAHEAGVGVDAEGNLYYLWVAADRLPYFSTSFNDGVSWSTPIMVGAPGLKEAALPALAVGGVGNIAFVYMGSTNSPGAPFPHRVDCTEQPQTCFQPPTRAYDDVTWNGYIAVSFDALSVDPIFWTATVNAPEDPLVRGTCGPLRCQEVYDFLDVRIGPDGTPWAAFVDACRHECATGTSKADDAGDGLAGRLWGGPGLWDDAASE